MDLNRLFQMLMRMVIKTAVDTGIDHAARRGKPEAEMTPEERLEAERGREMARRAKEVAKVTHRMWR
jgi:hypothetical protein